jgi:glycerol kinase
MQLIADLSNKEILIPSFPDMSSYGSLLMGFIGSGKCKNLEDLSNYSIQSKSYFPQTNQNLIDNFTGWKNIIERHYINNKTD